MSRPWIQEAIAEGKVRLAHVALDQGAPDGDGQQSNRRWHTIAVEGEWEGHWQGGFKVTEADIDRIVFNFDQLTNDGLVDYEHNSLNPFVDKAPAAGWIKSLLKKRDDLGNVSLRALIDWTPPAAEHIRNAEYRYLSPTIAFWTPDRVSGEDLGTSLHSVALTNRPFLDELPEVRLNSGLGRLLGHDRKEPEMQPQITAEQHAQLCVALSLPTNASTAQLLSEVNSSVTEMRALAQTVDQVAVALGLDEGAKTDKVLAAARALKLAADSAAEAEAEAHKLRVDAAIAKGRSEGKITPANEGWARKLASESPAMFEEFLSTATKVVPRTVKTPPSVKAGGGDKALTSDEKEAIQLAIDELGSEELKFISASKSLTAEKYVVANNLHEQFLA